MDFLRAANPSPPPEVLERLALEGDAGIKERVARNPSTPKEALLRLKGEGRRVRQTLAWNKSTPPSVLLDTV